MPTNLAQWECERFLYGDAAGDGKGDLLRVHAVKAEHAHNLVFSWLSGGASEVTLPNALPISRGGTGATTVAGVIRKLGYFEDTNHVLRRGTKVLTLGNTGILDRFQNMPNAMFTRNGVGDYSITGVVPGTALFGMVLPVNHLNQLKCYATTSVAPSGEMVIKVFEANNTTNPPSAGAPMDLPAGTYIDLEVK